MPPRRMLGFAESPLNLALAWKIEIGKYAGLIQHIAAIQSAIWLLKPKYISAISASLKSLSGHRQVKLVIAGGDRFLTDAANFRKFFREFSGVLSRW